MKMLMKNRKVLAGISTLLLISVVLLILAPAVLASHVAGHTDPATSPRGSGISDAAKGVATPALWVVNLILRTTLGILSLLLSASSYILGEAFSANINLNPANMDIVRIGWTIARDISNAFFLLIILWIAITIIFNIEQFGGRKLLGKVIIVALLINFSLVLVTVVFGFANLIAQQFAEQIKTADVGGIFVEATRVNTVTDKLTPSETAELKTYYNTSSRYNTSSLGFSPEIRGGTQRWGFKDTLLASVGIARAEAQVGTGLVGCGIGAIFAGPFGCVLGGIAGAGAAALWGKLVAGFNAAFSDAMALALGNIVMLMAVIALLYVAFTLVVRMVVEVLLSIFAPLALLLWVVPSSKVSQYWNMWLDYLLRWAFFAPAFYFIFYLTLLILQKYDAIVKVKTVASVDWDRILQILVAGVLLIAGVKLAKAAGGAVADTAIGLGKAIALGAVTGGAVGLGTLARRATPYVLPAEGAGMKALGRLAETPGLRWIGGRIPQKIGMEAVERGRKAVEEQEKRATTYSKDTTISRFKTAINPEEKVALLKRIVEKEWLQEAKRNYGVTNKQIVDATKLAEGYGMHRELAKKSLTFITPENWEKFYTKSATIPDFRTARREHMKKLTPENITQMSDDAVDAELAEDMWKTLGPAYISAIQRQNPSLMEKLNEELRKNPAWTQNMPADTYRFMKNNILGLRLPAESLPPAEFRTEEVNRLNESIAEKEFILSQKRQQLLSAAGATVAELNKDIRKMERKIEELKAKRAFRGGTP